MSSVEIPVAVPSSAMEHTSSDSIGGQGPSSALSAVQSLDLWLENFRKYEATLVCLHTRYRHLFEQ